MESFLSKGIIGKPCWKRSRDRGTLLSLPGRKHEQAIVEFLIEASADYADDADRIRIRSSELPGEASLLNIFVDADACPVKQEVYRVAKRYNLDVTLVAGSWMRVPDDVRITLKVVKKGIDAADDWIVEHLETNDIVVTGDIPLAARCIEKGAYVLGPTGKPFTEDNIGPALASRNLLSELREAGDVMSGPPPFGKRDRSRFLQALDKAVNEILRRKA